jgi:glycosyltransferase involved in cell wall biosynthesis
MRILVIHNYYQQWGGESAAVNAQVALLRRAGHTVVAYERSNAEIARFQSLRKCAFFWRSFYSHDTYCELRGMIACGKPDVMHVHNVFPLITPSAYLAARDAELPIVQTIHNFRFLCPNGLFYTHGHVCERCIGGDTLHAIRRRCYRDSYTLSALYAAVIGIHRLRGTWNLIDRFIALTGFTARKLAESGLTTPDKIRELGNFLPDPLPEPGPMIREPYLVYVGRLSPEKGIDIAIRAMAHITGMRLVVLGDGPQRSTLERLASEQGSHTEFRGHITGEGKWEILRQATATIVPSLCYENFPLAVLESYAVGTPVLASNLGSLPFIVRDDETGTLFAPGDPRDLGQAISQLVNDPKQARMMGERARKVAEQRYTTQAHYEQLMSIYSEVIR